MIEQKSNHIVNDGVSITIPRTPVNYTGKATVARFKGSYSDYVVQNRRLINTLLEANLATGELIQTVDETFLCVVSKKENIQGTDASIIAHGLLCNATLTVTRGAPSYDENGNQTGETTTTIVDAAPCRADLVTARMRQEDPGLLTNAVMKVTAKVDAGVQKLDKATIAGNEYRVEHIDTLQIPGAMVLQLSTWTG